MLEQDHDVHSLVVAIAETLKLPRGQTSSPLQFDYSHIGYACGDEQFQNFCQSLLQSYENSICIRGKKCSKAHSCVLPNLNIFRLASAAGGNVEQGESNELQAREEAHVQNPAKRSLVLHITQFNSVVSHTDVCRPAKE
jgi:hypothetical protein